MLFLSLKEHVTVSFNGLQGLKFVMPWKKEKRSCEKNNVQI